MKGSQMVPMNPIDDKERREAELVEYEHKMAQKIAEAMWAVATSNNHAIARYDSESYVKMDDVLKCVLKETFKVNDTQYGKIRDLLAEYGPHDTLTGTTGHGITSYVMYVVQNTLPKGWRTLSTSALTELQDKLDDDDAIDSIYEELGQREREYEYGDEPRDQLDYPHNQPYQY